MPEPGTDYTATFTVAEGRELEALLDREVAAAMAVAHPQGLGVLLIRHDARTFTVEASPEAPAGVVLERDLLARRAGPVKATPRGDTVVGEMDPDERAEARPPGHS